MHFLRSKIRRCRHVLDPAVINLLAVAADGMYRVQPPFTSKWSHNKQGCCLQVGGERPLVRQHGPGTPCESRGRRATKKLRTPMSLSNVIYMDDRISRNQPSRTG